MFNEEATQIEEINEDRAVNARRRQRFILKGIEEAIGDRGGRFFLGITTKSLHEDYDEYVIYDPEVRYFHGPITNSPSHGVQLKAGPAPSWNGPGALLALTFILGRSEDNRTSMMECKYLSHDEETIVFAGEGISRIDSPRAVATSSGWVYVNGKPITNSSAGAVTHQFEGEDIVYVYVPTKNVPVLKGTTSHV